MSFLLSIAFIKIFAEPDRLFWSARDAFKQELEGRLFYINPSSGFSPCSPMLTERFLGPSRAKLVTASILHHYARGIILYPEEHGLFTLIDSIVQPSDIYFSGRERLPEMLGRLREKPDSISYTSLPAYMGFLRLLSQSLRAQIVHMMGQENPATHATAVHWYESGEYVDNFYSEYTQTNSDLVEMPQHPELVRKLINGRFAFLLRQPRKREDDATTKEYFNLRQHFPTTRRGQMHLANFHDPWHIRSSRLFIPLWENKPLPFGAIFCPGPKLPDWLDDEEQ